MRRSCKKFGIKFSFLFLLTFGFGASVAQEAQEQPDLASQRYHYQKAKTALAKEDRAAFEEHLSSLEGYPLKQYLEFASLRANFEKYPFKDIDSFLTQYSDTFLESRLRANFLFFLAGRQQWQPFLKYYRSEISNLSLKCHYLHARIRTGDPSALLEASDVWNEGKSRPKQCDPLFKTWAAAGQMTDKLILSRISKSISKGEISLARYLSRKLKDNEKLAQAELFLQVHRNPSLVKQTQDFQQHDETTQHIVAHGIQRLAKKAPLDALYFWEIYEAQQIFPQDLIRSTKHTIVKRLIRAGHTQEAHTLLSYSRALRQQDLVQELAREALEEMNWQQLSAIIGLLDEENQQSDRWQYWAARIEDEIGSQLTGFAPANDIYQKLAKNRSFYGFLAADKLNQSYSLADNSTQISDQLKRQVAQLGAMQRAHELWLTGNTTEARAEWLHLSQSLSDEQLLATGQLARDWGWYNTGIQAMISGNFWDEITVRFPLAYREEVFKIAGDTQVEPTLIYAIARQESAFDAEAQSPVGAMGLMQLMPKTALYTAKKSGIKHAQKGQLLDAEHNMRLGSHYLNHLLEKFDGNRILAAAAYNAGPHRVNRWLSSEGKERPVDIWIETIPFKETRHYVQNVLCFSVIYAYRLGIPTDFLSKEEANQLL